MQQNASLRLPDFLNDKKTDYTYSPNGLGHRKDQLGCSLPWPNGPIFACLPPKHSPRTGSLLRSRCWRDRWHVGITHFIFIRCAIIIVGICLKPVRILIDQFNQHPTLVMIKTAYSICNTSNSNLIWLARWIINFLHKNIYTGFSIYRIACTYTDIVFQFKIYLSNYFINRPWRLYEEISMFTLVSIIYPLKMSLYTYQ